jgi:hypothetical protein
MLERETESILATLTARTIGARESVQLREALAADIPRGVKAYLRAETTRWLTEDLQGAPRFSHIDQSLPGNRRIARSFLESMAAVYMFQRNEFLGLLDNAVHFLENYLCRPQWTIENFAFERADLVPVEKILEKLECTAEYSYFKTLIGKLAGQRGWTEISRGKFRDLLIAIDDQIVKQHDARELSLLAKPIFDFILLRDTPPDAGIPLRPVLVFFEDKGMKILRDYIESICKIRGREEITLDELTALVEDLYLGQGDQSQETPAESPAPANEPPPAPPAPAAPVPVFIESPPVITFITDEPDGSLEEPPPADFDQKRNPEPRPHERREPVAPPRDARNISLSLTFAGLPQSRTPDPSLADLREMITGHARSRFIKHVFGRDEEKYNQFIATLNDAPTWKDASILLIRFYRETALDPYDGDVVAFTDSIHRRYLNPEGEGE